MALRHQELAPTEPDYALSWRDHISAFRAPNTVAAYQHNLKDFLAFCGQHNVAYLTAKPSDIVRYIKHLATRPSRRRRGPLRGLSLATQRQRVASLRLYYDFLEGEEIINTNPVLLGKLCFLNPRQSIRGLLPSCQQEAWIPSDTEWNILLDCMQAESLRNRTMASLNYDTAMRREELCKLDLSDIDQSRNMVRVRAETTKTKQGRRVVYSPGTAKLLQQYILSRRPISPNTTALFISESNRTEGDPIQRGTWTKVIESVARRANLPRFTPHTFRHLRITDLIRQGVGIVEIAHFVGHRDINTTNRYVHLQDVEVLEKTAEAIVALRANHLPAHSSL
ncbi:site-specific integrase [Hymenobacter sediminis]|uniref:tyrosine-type recombinase/integrase n=1 Tax=Hymenobacter sediminis TaxID=2218621 RepID=UPI000DA6A62D|nr:site-specific integrase [Hymenobacter sediminis]RPD44120.1 site-specific integrase [Hymenobacter sediminis]